MVSTNRGDEALKISINAVEEMEKLPSNIAINNKIILFDAKNTKTEDAFGLTYTMNLNCKNSLKIFKKKSGSIVIY